MAIHLLFWVMTASQGVADPAARLALAGVPAGERAALLTALAEKNKSTPLQELLRAIERGDPLYGPSLPDLGGMLAAWDPLELEKVKPELEKLARNGLSQTTRRAAVAAWIVAENDVNRPYIQAEKARPAMLDLLAAISSLPDDYLRRTSFELVRLLMFASTRELATPEGLKPALRVSLYETPPPGAGLEQFTALKPTASVTARQIGEKLRIATRAERTGIVFSGVLRLPEDGSYGLVLIGDDAARLYVDGSLRASRPAFGGVGPEAVVALAGGPHSMEVTCVDGGGGLSLGLEWVPPGGSREPVPAAAFDDPDSLSVREAAIRTVKRIPGSEEAKTRDLLGLMSQDLWRDALIDTLAAIPEQHWVREQARSGMGEVLAHAARNARGAGRRPAAYRNAVATARAMARKLEGEEREAALRAIVDLETFDSLSLGRRAYLMTCARCHQAAGEGLPSVVPPLARSEWVDSDAERSIEIVLHGLKGAIAVRGGKYIDKMPGQGHLLDDEETAAAINYVATAWGNKGGTVTAQDVARIRGAPPSRAGSSWGTAELLKRHPLR